MIAQNRGGDVILLYVTIRKVKEYIGFFLASVFKLCGAMLKQSFKKRYSIAVIVFNIYDEKPYKVENEKFFLEFVRNAFTNRRKTLVNNINQAYHLPKDVIETVLVQNNFDPMVRSEALSIEDFILLSSEILKVK